MSYDLARLVVEYLDLEEQYQDQTFKRSIEVGLVKRWGDARKELKALAQRELVKETRRRSAISTARSQ